MTTHAAPTMSQKCLNASGGSTDLAMVTSPTSTIVPANRFGQLLAEARLRSGADLEELAKRSHGEFTVGELHDLEAGHRSLDDALIETITTLYEVDCGIIVPQRAELTIDLDMHVMSASGRAVPLESQQHDHILDRYLSLVYLLRNRQPGSSVPLRDEDVAILAASLAERSELIEEQLLAAMAADTAAVRGLIGWLRQRLWVPGAGALVGAVSIGTLVMVTEGPAAPPSPAGLDGGLPDLRSNAAARIGLLGATSGATSQAGDVGSPTTTASAPATTTSTAAASPAASDAPTTTLAESGWTPEQMGEAAEALLPFDWEAALPGWRITYAGSHDRFRGLTFPYDQTIEMYVRADDTPESLAGILAHELGHAVDVTHFKDADRDEWLEARGIPATQWWPDAYASDFETGAGDFAEAFAYWALGDPTSSRVGGTPTTGQLLVLEGLIAGHL